MRVLLPKRLSNSLRPAATLHPVSLSIKDEFSPCSSASMVLPEGERLTIRDWVRLYTADGDAGIYRVTAVYPAYPGSTTVTLAHGLCALDDASIIGKGTLDGTLGEIVGQLLPHQKAKIGDQLIFATGSFAQTPRITLEYENSNLLDLIKQACEKLPDHKITVDQSSMPWRIGCEALQATPTAEGRFSRNMQTVSIDMDDDDLCTRLVVQRTDADGNRSYTTHDADTIETYGIVERVYEPPFGAADADISAYVEEYLRQHKEPSMSITVDMRSLCHLTGEPADRLTTGKLLRCCMPDFGTTITYRIMTVEYTDLMADPLAVRVYLRNKTKNASDLIRQVQQQSASLRRSYGRSSYKLEQTGWDLVRTYEELTELDEYTRHLYNEVGIKLNAVDSTILAYAESFETLFDETGTLKETSSEAWEKIDGMNAAITLHSERLTSIGDTQSDLIGEIEVLAGEVNLKASQKTVDGLTDDVDELSTTFTVGFDGIRSTIQDSETVITELKNTINGLEHWVTDTDGNVAELVNTVRGMQSTVTSVDGRMGTISNTVSGFTSTVQDQTGAFATLKTRIDEVTAHVRDVEGSIGTLTVRADQVSASVGTANGKLGTLTTTADNIVGKLLDQDGRMSKLDISIDKIESSVQNAEGAIGRFAVEANRITGELTNATGKITALMELTEDRFDTVIGDIKKVDGRLDTVEGSAIWQDRNKIVTAVGKVSTLERDINTIEGSAIWQDRANIAAVVGKMEVGGDGKIHVKSGSGLMIDEGSSSFGVYTSNNLTAGVMVDKINGGSVKIKAARIDLQGYVTASQLSAEIADINLNLANTVATDTLRASSAIISFLTFQDTYCTLKSGNFVTGVTFPVYLEKTLYYLDWDGNKKFERVLTPTKNTVGSVSKSNSYKYIGA